MTQVFVFEIEDADADSWTAEVALVADSPAAAARQLKDRGLHKKQIRRQARPVRTMSTSEFGTLFDVPGVLVRRRLHDSGWSPWTVTSDEVSLSWRVSGTARVRSSHS